MKTLIYLLPAFLLVFFGAACSRDSAPEAASDESTHQPEGDLATQPPATKAEMQDGVQVVHITVGEMGYDPRSVALKEGVPARIIFTRTVDSSCAEQVQLPAFDIDKTNLPLDEPVAIEFMPNESGEFDFVCGMDMMRGTIVVEV